MSEIDTYKLTENDLLGKVDGHLQEALAAADDFDNAVDEYNTHKSPLDALDKKFEALNERIDAANFQRHMRESALTPTGADTNISGAADAIDGLDAYRNMLDENLAAVMSKWADAPYDAKSVDFSTEATNLANLLQSKIQLEGKLGSDQALVQTLTDLGTQLSAARTSGNFAEVTRIEHEIGRLYDQMPAPQNEPISNGKGGFYQEPAAPKPQISYGSQGMYDQPVGGKGGFVGGPVGVPHQSFGHHDFNNPFGRVGGQPQPQYISVDQALNTLISNAQGSVSSTTGSLNSTVGQIPGQYRNLTNDQLAVKIEELRNSTPSGFFSSLRPELEMNGNSNVMTLEELGAIKEFVQKTKERVTAVMAALARVIGMVGDTLLGVARLQQ